MTAMVTLLADALAAHLNGGEFDQSLTATVRFETELDLVELQQLQHVDVTVIPSDKGRARESRAVFRDEITVDLGVRRKVNPNDDAALRDLMLIVEQIEQHVTDFSPEIGGRRAVFMEIQTDPLFDPEELRTNHLFFSVMRVSFRAH